MRSPRTLGVCIALAVVFLAALPVYADVHSDIVALFQQTNGVAIGNDLTQGERTSLATKLIGALASLDKGNDHTAQNQIEAFTHEVEAMERSGRLATGDAAALLTSADAIIAQLP